MKVEPSKVEMPDVILAVASPPGRSPRGIIRISGNQTFDLISPLLEVEMNDATYRRGIYRARFKYKQFTIPCLALIFPAPHSYTGENSLELQFPGNPVLLERIIDSLIDHAKKHNIEARRAKAGEITARAFMSGKLSLTEAEGVAATIAAQSDAELRAAHLLTRGSLGTFAHQLADDLTAALALVEAGIDFTDQEDVVAIPPHDLYERLIDLRNRIETQLKCSVGMEQLQAIPWVVLIGEPNAGKSALFNALLEHERAVVSHIEGTTRDVITEPLRIDTTHGPAEVMLVDLAGFDEDSSSINQLMQSAAREAITRAELILRCVPINQPIIETNTNEFLVRTKSDLAACVGAQSTSLPLEGEGEGGGENQEQSSRHPPPRPLPKREGEIRVSAHTGDGISNLKSEISNRLANRAVSLAADALALRPRHEAALNSALSHLNDAIQLVEPIRTERNITNPELIASSMRAALNDLASLAGDITPDDVLGRIFSTFCVGK